LEGLDIIRVLLVADTHLGFDLPHRPRVQRRRRGPDFFANFKRALEPALQGGVDFVVHGGDLLYRSKVPPALVERAMAPLMQVASRGVPVYLVPGNHERSRIPLHLWAAHPHIHIFDRPKTYSYRVRGICVSLSGFAFQRDARLLFRKLLESTNYRDERGDIRLLCLHQTIEGAQVGPSDYTFRRGSDVIKGADIPDDFAALLCGHIHRAQTLAHDLQSHPLGAPVVYPGSVERTSFAERDEEKGYMILDFDPSKSRAEQLIEVNFIPLPTRPMVKLEVFCKENDSEPLEDRLRREITTLDPESIVRVELKGPGHLEARGKFSAAQLRELAPTSMNINFAPDRRQFRSGIKYGN